jgi:filamentous hemagglutinin family protein
MLLKTWNCQTKAIWLSTAIVMAAIASNSTVAQITPDNTLGNERSVVVPGLKTDIIDGGAIRGANLFHSFLDFNIKEGRGAYFFVPNAGIDNVLTRVTGNNPSKIFGRLGTFGNSSVNLFLLNPNGIIFGQNASLDVGGSFVATTANEIEFGNRGSFSANNPTSPGLLTINPSALLFNQMATQGIENRAILAVPRGESLLLAGGDIDLNGGALFAPGGNINLASLSSSGRVDLSFNDNQLKQGLLTGRRGDVLLNNTLLGVSHNSGGRIEIYAQNLDVFNSGIFSETIDGNGGGILLDVDRRMLLQGEGTSINSITYGKGAGGNLTINTQELSIDDGTQVLAVTTGAGKGGNLQVTADKVVVSGTSADGEVFSGLFTQAVPGSTGHGGDLTINARQIFVTEGAQISASTLGSGDGGDVTINTRDLFVTEGASQIFASAIGIDPAKLSGDGGNLQVTADTIVLQGRSADGKVPSGLFTQIRGSTGNGGNSIVKTRELLVTDGAQISAGTLGSGDSGNLQVTADTVVLRGGSASAPSGLLTQAGRGNTGDAGDLTFNARQLLVTDGAQISASTFGSGDGGNLLVKADRMEIRGTSADGQAASGLFTQADPDSTGKAGDLTVNARQLFVTEQGQISTRTFGKGDGGDLTVNARQLLLTYGGQISASTFGSANAGNLQVTADRIEIRGESADGRAASGLFASANSSFIRFTGNLGGLTGNAGDLTINTRELLVTEGAEISASTEGSGDGGNLTVTADTIVLQGTSADGLFPSGLFTQADRDSTGDGGDLTIATRQLFITDGARISAASVGKGDAGDIHLQANSVRLDNGSMAALTTSGEGGNITFGVSDLLLLNNNSSISTTAGGTGNGGNMAIDTRFLVAVDDSDITANAFEGNGGNIDITAQGIFRSADSDITASSQLGIDGSVRLNTPDIDPSRGLVNLPSDVVDASRQIDRTCYRPTASGNPSQFIITGRGGLPATLGETTSQEQSLVGLVSPVPSSGSANESSTPTPNSNSEAPLPLEAQGWVVDANGDIYLTAQMPNPSPPGSQLPNGTCDRVISNPIKQP